MQNDRKRVYYGGENHRKLRRFFLKLTVVKNSGYYSTIFTIDLGFLG
jgi:hypothetical protein